MFLQSLHRVGAIYRGARAFPISILAKLDKSSNGQTRRQIMLQVEGLLPQSVIGNEPALGSSE